jgi:hypothetical protein
MGRVHPRATTGRSISSQRRSRPSCCRASTAARRPATPAPSTTIRPRGLEDLLKVDSPKVKKSGWWPDYENRVRRLRSASSPGRHGRAPLPRDRRATRSARSHVWRAGPRRDRHPTGSASSAGGRGVDGWAREMAGVARRSATILALDSSREFCLTQENAHGRYIGLDAQASSCTLGRWCAGAGSGSRRRCARTRCC